MPPPLEDWWQRGVVYQVYPRSFADSDGDGVGDLPGIIAHLDHLESLGVDAIWLSPIYPSPGRDLGYDVADHAAVDPLFGTLEDFERLVADAHGRGMAVILDLVLNHTSDLHRWFVDSRLSRTSDHADWYLWRDPAGWRRARPLPPNNWQSFFGGSGWTWEPRRGQFYFHTFLAEQPDLNWRHPPVREAQLAMVRGWLARGVDGFRLDVINTLFKHPDLPSNPRRIARSPAFGSLRAWSRQVHLHDRNQPELAAFLAEFRSIVDAAPGRMTVGELFDDQPEVAASYAAARHLMFDFGLLAQPWEARRIAAAVERIETAFGPGRWPAVVLSNHDQPRQATRFARGPGRDSVARAAAVLLLTLRGTPFLYYGEEIGLGDVTIPRAEIIDPPARRYWPLRLWWNRDQCRTPMPWRPGPNAGFTTGRPWLRMTPDAQTRNVALEAADPNSVLAAYRRLIALRRTLPALQTGSFRWLARTDDVLGYARETAVPSETVVVAINVRDRAAEVSLDDGSIAGSEWRLAYSSVGGGSAVGTDRWSTGPRRRLHLAAREAVILAAAPLRSSG